MEDTMELLQEVDPPSNMVDDTQSLMYDKEATDDDDDDGLLLVTEEEYTVEDSSSPVKADSVSTEHVSDNDIDNDWLLLL